MKRWQSWSLLLSGVAFGLVLNHAIEVAIGEAQAHGEAAAAETCTWSYVKDNGYPNIGENGTVKLEQEWAKMSAEGWKLKATIGTNVYLFEKCN